MSRAQFKPLLVQNPPPGSFGKGRATKEPFLRQRRVTRLPPLVAVSHAASLQREMLRGNKARLPLCHLETLLESADRDPCWLGNTINQGWGLTQNTQ